MIMKNFLIAICFLSFVATFAKAEQTLPCATTIGEFVQATSSANYFIKPGDCLISEKKKFFAILQGDGNFVVYPTSNPSRSTNLWNSHTDGKSISGALVQQDGHMVIYGAGGIVQGTDGKYNGIPSQSIWISNKETIPFNNYYLIMQDDGNLVLYKGTPANNIGYQWDAVSDNKRYPNKNSPSTVGNFGTCLCNNQITLGQCLNTNECDLRCRNYNNQSGFCL